MDTLTDSALVARTLEGDRPAFEILVDRYQTLVCSLAYAITGDLARSEDVGQESLVQAWETLDRLQQPDHFKSWLCGITRNVAKNSNRSQRTRTGTSALEELPTAAPTAEQQVVDEEEQTLVWQTLETLPEKYREPLVLFYRQEQSISQVADSLDVSTEVIKQRLSRGRGMLRDEVTATIEHALSRRVPSRAFTAAVLAMIPIVSGGTASAGTLAASGMAASGASAAAVSAASATGATLGTTVAGKPASAISLAKTGGLLTPAAGVLIGIAGGVLGAWCSWKAARYQSQRDLIVRMSLLYIVGLAIFSLPYVAMKFGWEPWVTYGPRASALMNLAWMGTFMIANVTWMLTVFRSDAAIRKRAQEEEEETLTPADLEVWVQQYEGRCWTSQARLWGAPLIDLRFSDPGSEWRGEVRVVANGWIAIGDYAVGRLFAMGNFACAPIALGNISLGIVSIGVVNAGLLSFGVVSLGVFVLGIVAVGCFAIGIISIGYMASGVVGIGWHAASGVVAFAYNFAVGQIAYGPRANSEAAQSYIASSPFFRLGNKILIDSAQWARYPMFFALAIFLVAIVVGTRWIYRRKQTTEGTDVTDT